MNLFAPEAGAKQELLLTNRPLIIVDFCWYQMGGALNFFTS
jgi:hypothetical protein